MKFCLPTIRSRRSIGFTLPEVLIAATLFILLMGGVIAANLFGMRMSQLTQTKLKAGDDARKALGMLTDEIRCAKAISLGNVSNGVFVALLDGDAQTSTALMVQQTTNASNYVIYFVNANDRSFRRTLSSGRGTSVVAASVTNSTVFTALDCLGKVLTNNQNNPVIHVALEFYRAQPNLPTPDYYKLETAATRRVLE